MADRLTLKDLDRTLAAHTTAIDAHEAKLEAARQTVRDGIEAYVQDRLKSPDHRMTDREFAHLLGDLEDTHNNLASQAANEGYVLGRIPGYRIGFELAGHMHLMTTPDLPGIPAKELPMFAALAMVDDLHSAEIVAAMMEMRGEADPE